MAWGEDPRYKKAELRLIVYAVGTCLVFTFVMGIWVGEWGVFQQIGTGVCVVLAAMGILTLTAWLIVKVISGFKK